METTIWRYSSILLGLHLLLLLQLLQGRRQVTRTRNQKNAQEHTTAQVELHPGAQYTPYRTNKPLEDGSQASNSQVRQLGAPWPQIFPGGWTGAKNTLKLQSCKDVSPNRIQDHATS